MKIIRVKIQNFRSIRSIDIECSSKLNAFIGENSVGKSNIFDAINWLLGPVYPSFNSTLPQDHYLGSIDNKISITLYFDDGNYLQLAEIWYDFRQNEKSGLNLSGNYITDIDRQRYCSAYLGVDRAIVDYLPSNRWSLLGRILLEINSLFKNEEVLDETTGEIISKPDLFKKEIETIRDTILFTVKNREGTEVMKLFIETLQRESAKQLNRAESDFSVDLNLYDPWNFYRTLQLIVTEPEINLSFQASSLGMGIQASISIAVLKAYSQIKLNNSTPLFIDEPELYLHPQAQRCFYKVLHELAESGTQIFFTTHSPDFLNVGRFNEIFLVRKSSTEGTYVRFAKAIDFIEDLHVRLNITTNEDDLMLHYKNAYEETGDTQKANEAFFAKKIILVEGQSESLCLPYFFELLGFDYIAEGVTIVRCGDKNDIDRFYRLYSEFGIPCYVIFDGDKNHFGTKHQTDTVKKNKAILKCLGIDADFPDGVIHDNFLGFKNSLNEEIGFSSSNKGLSLYKQLKSTITSREQIPDWVPQLIEKIKNMSEIASSVLLKAH
ncbi:ATP-dependent nuclease [Paludibacter jiangxiensis]|uniref:Putative ATP-dependent endonuclease of the OLD family n=1 Tax=Paludibacter jiangxiensis TaxID=681398 RepID=A0A161LFJ5_9BACT|nr:AAA family ATPase [Paludibacter jiangxiensis]GAT63397.1 putative ATP-dependent endonuclease of the OLD family [Paludibacter jiangxiensis]